MQDIHWKPVKDSSIPLHLQISEYIKQKIMYGEWTLGMKIPTQRALSQQFQVNRSTIVYALDHLIADGLLETKVGSGTYVINNTWSLLSSPPLNWNNYVQSGIHKPNRQIIQEINKAEAIPTIIRLGTGELAPDLLPDASLQKILQSAHQSSISLGYVEPKGLLSLRKSICDYLRTKEIMASPESILVVSGGLQALQLLSVGLLERGATILHESPSYLNSIHVFQSAGMHLLGIPLDKDGLEMKEIESIKKQHNAQLIYTIPTFHNPTGTVMSESRRSALLKISNHISLPIIEDDVYGDLWFTHKPPRALKSNDTHGNVLYIGSISKTLSPGLRIGWIVGPEPVIDRLADIKMQTDYGSSTLSQFAVQEWLNSGLYEDFLKQTRKKLKIKRDYTLELLNKHFSSLATWNIPEGGFYIWLRLHSTVSTNKIFDIALRHGILLNPGSVYDNKDTEHLRISYSYATLKQLDEGLKILAKIVQDLKT